MRRENILILCFITILVSSINNILILFQMPFILVSTWWKKERLLGVKYYDFTIH